MTDSFSTPTLSLPPAGRPLLVPEPKRLGPVGASRAAAAPEGPLRQPKPNRRSASRRRRDGPETREGSRGDCQLYPEPQASSRVGVAACARVFRRAWTRPAPDGEGKICLAIRESWARLFGRASESVTRSDRRERERGFERPFPPLTARPNRRREDVAGRRGRSAQRRRRRVARTSESRLPCASHALEQVTRNAVGKPGSHNGQANSQSSLLVPWRPAPRQVRGAVRSPKRGNGRHTNIE